MTKNSKHIVFLLDNPFISDLRVEKEAISLLSLGHRVTIVCVEDEGLQDDEVVKGIRVLRMVPKCFNRPFSKGYSREVKNLAKRIEAMQCDVLHCHDCYMLRMGIEVKRKNPSVTLVYDTHEYLRGWKFYQDIPGRLSRFKGYIVWKYFLFHEKKACRHQVHGVITTTHAISEKLVEKYSLPTKPLVLRNVTNLTNQEQNESLRSILNIPDDHLIMVQSGNIYQRIDEALQMFESTQRVENLHYVIINNRPVAERIRSAMKNDKRNFDRIHIIDYNSKTLLSLLKSADFGLLFMRTKEWESHYLTSPNRIYEYSQANLPFLSVPQVSSKELSDKFGHVVFFEQNDPISFLNGIKEMTTNLSKYRKNAQKSDFQWVDEFDSVGKFYDSLQIN